MIALDDLRHLPDKEQAGQVNARVNRAVRYRPDVGPDHWQTPEESFRRGAGDCEDIAIAKMACLLALGWDQESLRLVYCKRVLGRVREAHMILEARLDGEAWVLDNLGTLITTWEDRIDLHPLFSFNANQLWVGDEATGVDPKQRLGQWGKCLRRAAVQSIQLEGEWV